MDVTSGFFYAFAALLLFAALRVVTARNPVHAVLYLMLAFSQAAGLWLLIKAEFLGITLVLVYLGAVMVLFLFVVMMLDLHIESLGAALKRNALLAALLGLIVVAELVLVQIKGFGQVGASQVLSDAQNTKALGELLYRDYLYPIVIASVILLVAMIAAIALTLRERKDSKAINPALQVRVKAADRLVVLKMDATVAGATAQVEEK